MSSFWILLGILKLINGIDTSDASALPDHQIFQIPAANLTNNLMRFKRAADTLSDYSGKLSTVARISNGISLLADLINKNIPIDNVISELLNFGNVKLSDVVALQKNKILGVIGNLESVQKTLEGSPNLEDKIMELFGIQALYAKVGDFSSVTVPTLYFRDINGFAASSLNVSDYSNIARLLGELVKKMDDLHLVDDSNLQNAFDAFGKIKDTFSEYTGKIQKSMMPSEVELNRLCRILNQDVFQALKPMLSLLEVHKNSASQGSAGSPGDLTKLQLLNTELKEIDLVLKLVSTKSQSGMLNNLRKDIQDDSVKNAIGTAGNDFSKLPKGLKPLIDLMDKLEPVNKKLENLTDSRVLNTMKITKNLQTLMSATDDAKNSLDSLERGQFSSFSVDDMTNLMKDSKKLSDDMLLIKEVANRYLQSPEFQKWHSEVQDAATGFSHAQYKLLKMKREWSAVKVYFLELQKAMKRYPDVTETQNVAKRIRDTLSKFDAFRTKVINDVIPKLEILKDAAMDPVIQTLQIAKIIRNLTPEDIANLKLAVETITNESGVISGIQKTSLKNQTEDVKDLLKWKDLQNASVSLESAALCIQNMEEFSKLAPLVQKIKGSTVFDQEILKVKDPKVKDEILKKYGDPNAFVGLLESVLRKIEAFKAKLVVEKDLRNLGKALESAKLVDDVAVGEKLEAIQMLTLEAMKDPNNLKDPKVLKDLDELKSHLETLAALDLQFSNHHMAFPGVTDALNSFFDFLGGFLTPRKVPSRPPKPSGAGKPSGTQKPSGVTGKPSGATGTPAEDGSNVGLFVGIGIGVFLGLCAFLISAFWWYRRQNKDKKKPWNWIKRWFARTSFHTIPDALTYGKGIVKEMNKGSEDLKMKKTDSKKMRNPAQLVILETALILPDGRFINANFMTTWDGLKMIVAQGPMDNTAADFIFMIISQDCEFVVMLCKTSEVTKYVPDHPKEVIRLGDYEITMESMEDADKAVVIRKLVALDTKEKKSHKFTHIQHCEWTDLGIPKSSDDVVGILETVNKSKKPVLVHCATGVGRSVVLAGAEIIARDVERHPRKTILEPFAQLAKLRHKGFQNLQQGLYTVLLSYRLLLNQYAKGSAEDEKMFAAQLDMFEKVVGVLKMEEDGWAKEVNRPKTIIDGLPEIATNTARPESSKETMFMVGDEKPERSQTVFDELPTMPAQAPRAAGGNEQVAIEME